MIIDAQVHAYERDRPERPWAGFLHGPAEATGEQMVQAMDTVGVDGAILVSPFRLYRFDPSYAIEVQAQFPERFALVRPFDPRSSDIDAEMRAWAARPGVVGARIMLPDPHAVSGDDPGYNQMLESAARYGLAVNLLCWGNPPLAAEFARRHPDTQIVLDHLGLAQPFEPPVPDGPFGDLTRVLELAEFDNVVIKITGACTLSTERFPFPDIWDPVLRVVDAFSIERCLWGTDWTRAVHMVSYIEGVEAFHVTDRFSASDRAKLMCENAARVYGWQPPGAG